MPSRNESHPQPDSEEKQRPSFMIIDVPYLYKLFPEAEIDVIAMFLEMMKDDQYSYAERYVLLI